MTQSHLHAGRGASLPQADGGPDLSPRVMHTYLVGVYLAVNALRDAYLIVDGPDCSHMKTQFVQGSHDWLSTLTSVSGFHRVTNTALHPVQMARSREDNLRTALARLAGHDSTAAVLISSMPMAFITGADYDRLAREVTEATAKTVVHVPGKSLSGDWLDGYGEALTALARQIPLPAGQTDPSCVGIVGYLYDRNERDHVANTAHLRDLLARVGLPCVSIWLEGQRFAQLADIARAGTILSFPYGRKAAAEVARRTGARLLECELPFGLEATERWLRQVAEACGVGERAAAVIDAELAVVVPPLEWMIPYTFQGRRVGYIGDPHLLPGIREIAATLGAELRVAVVTNPPAHAQGLRELLGPRTRLQVWPKQAAFRGFIDQAIREEQVSLLVTNHHGVGVGNIAWVELGYPSMYRHALYDRPFLGFQGFLSFVDLMANASRQHDVYHALGALGRTTGSRAGEGGPAR